MYRIISFLYSSSCRIAIQSRSQHGYQAEKRSAFKERKACCITTRNCLHSLTSFTGKRSRANICVCRMKDVFLMRVALVCLKSPTVFTIKQSFSECWLAPLPCSCSLDSTCSLDATRRNTNRNEIHRPKNSASGPDLCSKAFDTIVHNNTFSIVEVSDYHVTG